MTFVSYAQNFEDVLLWRALREVEHGRYFDIGAQDPVIDSVSLAFYESGWRGVHVEPTSFYAEKLRAARPDEIVIEAAVTDSAGPIKFYELGGLSSGREDIAKHHMDHGLRPQETLVPTVSLDNLLGLIDGDIHWLKIDVEGMEADVLRSWRESPIRPWILVVESTYPNSEKPTQHLWIDEVLQRGYDEVFFDGLSRYFLHESHAELADRLNRPANVFDSYQITLQHFSAKQASEEISSLQQASEAREAQQAALILEQRERIRVATADLDKQRAAHASLEKRSVAEIKVAQSRIEAAEAALADNRARLEDALIALAASRARLEGAETMLAADRAKLGKLSAQQRESAAEIDKLNKQLSSEREVRVDLNAEILEIAKLVEADLADAPGLGSTLRSVPGGSTFAAVKSRLHLATRELDLLRNHADRQFAAGQCARDVEVSFLQERNSALQTEISDVRGRLTQFEAAYASARDRSEAADKEKARLQSLLDEQAQALDSVRSDAAALGQQLVEARGQLASISRSTAGRLASFFGLLPQAKGGRSSSTAPPTSIDAHDLPDEIALHSQNRTENAVNDVRHVNSLLTLNGTAFVDGLYRTFLKRAPDRAGRDHFVSRLLAGHGKEAVLLAVATSKEAQALGAPIEGIAELQKAQARKGGWFAGRDREFDNRLNRLEHMVGEAHNQLFDRLDGIRNSVDQIQAAIGGGAVFKSEGGTSSPGRANGVRQSIKQGISIASPTSAPEFIESLRREVQSSSEAQALRRS